MTESVQITVAIPTYNRRVAVCSLVDSLLSQLGPDDELLVIDDGSRDGTADALRSVARVRLIVHDPNRGMVGTWNDCLLSAARDWVCLIHDDDSVTPNTLDAIRRACLVARQPALISFDESNTNVDTRFRCRVIDPGPWSVLHCPGIPSGVTIHREVIEKVGVFDERFAYSADLEYFPRIAASYRSVIVESPPGPKYNQHTSNYQYETWRRPDFFDQLEEIELLVMRYTGLPESATNYWKRERWIAYMTHIFNYSARINDKAVLRNISQRLRNQPGISRQMRAYANVAAALAWVPPWFRS